MGFLKRARTDVGKVVAGCDFEHETRPFPRMRNFILDIMKEGKRQDTIYATFDVDVTRARERIRAFKARHPGRSISFTAYVAHCLALTVDAHKHMHALRQGKRHRVIFDAVDVALMIEREVEGYRQPVNYIIRGANRKTLPTLDAEITTAARAPLGEDWALNRVEMFFWKCPRFLRKLFWFISRRKATWRKLFVGTVGLTSMGMFARGTNCTVLPITPTPLTVAVGTIAARVVERDGEFQTREFLNVVVGVDHDLIDGGPLVRFVDAFKDALEAAPGLPPDGEWKEGGFASGTPRHRDDAPSPAPEPCPQRPPCRAPAAKRDAHRAFTALPAAAGHAHATGR